LREVRQVLKQRPLRPQRRGFEFQSEADAKTIVRMLLARGADMNAKNKQGVTAFEFGMWSATDGAAAIVAAGYRLPAEKAKQYREAYKGNAKVLALIDKASAAKK
jgi:hypothetical protein